MKVNKKLFNSMKKVLMTILCVVCVLFFAVISCGKHKENSCEECNMQVCNPLMAADCYVSSFLEGASKYSKCSSVYLIKGIVLDAYEYGLNIKLVEDFKGNFPNDVKTFIAWGAGGNGLCSERMDNLRLYNDQDELIMLLTQARDLSDMTPPEYAWLEKMEDYATITCTFSVLELSDGFVTGYILPYEDKDRWWEKMSMEEANLALQNSPHAKYGWFGIETIPYKDFQKKINKILKNK